MNLKINQQRDDTKHPNTEIVIPDTELKKLAIALAMVAMDELPNLLNWEKLEGTSTWQAMLGTEADGVRFSLSHYPTCYRRGPWRLLVEVMPGKFHNCWGCFDDQDQPMRWYHGKGSALGEANRLAHVLYTDRQKFDDKGELRYKQ